MFLVRAVRHSSFKVHQALFGDTTVVPSKTTAEMKQGIGQRMKRRWIGISKKAGHVPLGTFDQGLARLTGVQKIT